MCDTGFLSSFPQSLSTSINLTTASSIGSSYASFIIPYITERLSSGNVISISNCFPEATTPSTSITGHTFFQIP